MSKARAFVPRTSRTRAYEVHADTQPHRRSRTLKQLIERARRRHVRNAGVPEIAQEEQVMRESEEQVPEQDETRETPGGGSNDPIPRKDRPSGMACKKQAEAGTQASHGADAPDPSSYDLTTKRSRKQQIANNQEHLEEIASQMVARIWPTRDSDQANRASSK
eukprot:6274799-Amphidinium_carterae.1